MGQESNLGSQPGLANAWAANTIRQVGNYGELYERDITALGLARGKNEL